VGVVVNLGCGSRTHPACVNIDWSVYARLRKSPLGRLVAPLVVRGERRELLRAYDDSVIVHDLKGGIPLGDDTADVVYHSHFLEHLDRDVVPALFAEIRRVLKPGGVHRAVTPDLARHVVIYLDAFQRGDRVALRSITERILGQMVRRDAEGTSRQPPVRRKLENLVLGDARRRGETHQWFWDRISLREALEAAGFTEIEAVDHTTSRIPGWAELGLDTHNGREHKPDSLYMEALA
jgi:SAM-dependent methyltransferase